MNTYRNLFFLPALICLVAGWLFCSCNTGVKTSVESMLVEYEEEPMGVDVKKPRFSWTIVSPDRDIVQTAYQITVTQKHDGQEIWNSGEIKGNETLNIEYAGAPLKSNTTYLWRVGVTLNGGKTIWSNMQRFHTGILDESEWKARWIEAPYAAQDNAPYFRKSFRVEKAIQQAVVFVAAAGFYELYLNGKKIGDRVLDPAITDYKKTVLYSTYDLTELLQQGDNAFGAFLGNGARGLRSTENRWTWWGISDAQGKPALFAQLEITYTDGTNQTVVTDPSWKTAQSPMIYNDLYGGEDYDARKEIQDWNSVGFDDAHWDVAALSDGITGKLTAQIMPAIKVTETIAPITQVNPEPGVFLFDLGQNIAGWWRIEVEGTAGQQIRVRGGETLKDSLFGSPLMPNSEINFDRRHFGLVWTNYALKGGGKEVYEPRFFYSGFRYLEVTVSDKTNPVHLKLEGRAIRSSMVQTGMFVSSDSLLNKIYRASVWAQKGNLHGYPTDCPHREKGAYNGDGQVIAETSMHDFQMASFYTKWVNDMKDAQEENGRIPNTSPTLVGGSGGGVAWGSAYIHLPWWMYNYYQDKRILEEHYEGMKRYMNYLRNVAGKEDKDPSEPYIIDDFASYWFSLGEWCAPEHHTGKRNCPIHSVVNTFYFYYNSLTLSKIAQTLGHNQDSERYRMLSDTIKEAYNRKYFNPETGLYGTDKIFPTYQVLSLIGDAVPAEYREKVFRTVVDDIRARENHLSTGILGTKYLWPLLVNGGENQLLYTMLTQITYPGFGYWIAMGATTLLETWHGGDDSYNHQMFGSVNEYFYKFLAGIQSPMEGSGLGYRHIRIEPHIPEGLEAVDASVKTLVGIVSSKWVNRGGKRVYSISVPANTSATIVLPVVSGDGGVVVREGRRDIWKNNQFVKGVEGIHSVSIQNNRIVIESGSGNYQFRINT